MELKPFYPMLPIKAYYITERFYHELVNDWVAEVKKDGWRLIIIRKYKKEPEFWGRRLSKKPNWTKALRMHFSEFFTYTNTPFILDCELCCIEGRNAIPSLFARKLKDRKSVTPIIYIFDILQLGNRDLTGIPYWKRKEILKEVYEVYIKPTDTIKLIPTYKITDIPAMVKQVVNAGDEGLVLKRKSSYYFPSYTASVVTPDWIKVKISDIENIEIPPLIVYTKNKKPLIPVELPPHEWVKWNIEYYTWSKRRYSKPLK